jgi:hypothetical protein
MVAVAASGGSEVTDMKYTAETQSADLRRSASPVLLFHLSWRGAKQVA